ncbi:O-antigen ligase family protein [Paenibacillus sp. 22594]|uniref:O-antigen ligase family protein n=1 Tax=Paenibacillus sp. 22594 TaxID=3453947 RepID=UPI003F83F555
MRWNKRQNSPDLNIVYVCAGAVFTAGVAACLLRGLFFTGEMYPFLTVWFALCGLLFAPVLAVSELHKRTDGRGQEFGIPVVKKAALTLLGCLLAILVLYGWAGLRGPISAQGTLDELLRWGFYASFAVLAYFCAGYRQGARLLGAMWHMMGMAISLSALLAVCAGFKLPYAVAYTSAPEVSATGARLAGLLQYPNTFGAVMAVFLLERLFAAAPLMESAKPGTSAVKQSVATGVYGMLPLFPYAAALLLSESRGAWLTAAVAGAAVLLWKRQLCAPLLLAGAAPMAAAALFYRQLARAGLAVEPGPGLLLLAGLWGAALLGGAWLCRRRRVAAGGGNAARVALAAAVWTAAGSAVLLQVRERITGPSSTVAARGLLYRDAWKLAADAPWLGRGGGTWRSSYLAAQSRPYVGSQVHNGYLDLLLNLGGVGLAVLLLLLVAAGWLVAAAAHRLLPSLLALALHSAVDFDWSYGLMWLLLFLLPALARAEKLHSAVAGKPPKLPASAESPPVPGVSGRPAAVAGPTGSVIFSLSPARGPATCNTPQLHASAKPPPVPGGPGRSASAPDVFPVASNPVSVAISPELTSVPPMCMRVPVFTMLLRLWRVAAVSLLCSMALALFILSFQAMKGETLYIQAVGTSQNRERIVLLRQSLHWNPRDPMAAAALSRMLPGNQGRDLLLKSLKYSPENAVLNWELAKRALEGNHPGTALYWVRRGQQLDVFNAAKRIEAAEGMLDMSVRKLREGDWISARQSAEAGLELLRQYRLLGERESGKGIQHNDRRFGNVQEAEGLGLRLRGARSESWHLEAAIRL